MKLLTSVIIIVIVAGVGLYFLKKEVKKSDSVVADQTSKEDITNNPSVDEEKPMDTNKKMLENFTPIAKVDALQKIDIKVGTGKVVEAGATVSVHYTGAVAAWGCSWNLHPAGCSSASAEDIPLLWVHCDAR
jgi:hypothetical protein